MSTSSVKAASSPSLARSTSPTVTAASLAAPTSRALVSTDGDKPEKVQRAPSARRPASEVAAALERRLDLRPRSLVDPDALPAGSDERPHRALRDLERVPVGPASRLELGGRGVEIGDAVEQDGYVALKMAGEQESWRRIGQRHHRDARAHAVDREDESRTEHVGEELDVRRDILARHVVVVEVLEHGASPTAGARPYQEQRGDRDECQSAD